MKMENRIKKIIFRYLDELFKDIDIQDNEYPPVSFIPNMTGSKSRVIEGMIGRSILFSYFPDTNLLSFNTSELKTMVSVFGTEPRETLRYIKSYLVEHVDAIPHDVSVFGIT